MTARDDKRGAYVPLTRETIEIMRAGFHCFAVDQEQKVRLSTLCEMALQSLTYGSALSHVEQITQAAGESADVAGHMATPASGMESSQGGGKPPSTPSTTPQKPLIADGVIKGALVDHPSAIKLAADVLANKDADDEARRLALALLQRNLAAFMPSATALFTLDTAERVCFYEQEFYVLSNFSSFKVNWMGVIFNTSEHAYHWTRFPHGSPEQQVILESASAHDAFRFAQTHKSSQRADWDAVKVQAMREILFRKVEQHEYVRRKLLESGDRELVENSWRDDFWGWGPNRDGKNMLGKLWMEIRADLRRADGTAEAK